MGAASNASSSESGPVPTHERRGAGDLSGEHHQEATTSPDEFDDFQVFSTAPVQSLNPPTL
jgi:hypothetical protein